jgi:hypothetical protein
MGVSPGLPPAGQKLKQRFPQTTSSLELLLLCQSIVKEKLPDRLVLFQIATNQLELRLAISGLSRVV